MPPSITLAVKGTPAPGQPVPDPTNAMVAEAGLLLIVRCKVTVESHPPAVVNVLDATVEVV